MSIDVGMVEASIDTAIDIGIDTNLDTVIDNELKSFETTETKTYEAAIAIIKQMVLRDRRTQRDCVEFLNTSGYATANGQGEWTPVKMSREVQKLKKLH